MYLSTSTHSQIKTSFTPSRAEPIESYFETNLKAFNVQSSPILCPCSNYILGYNLHLKDHLGEENSLPNKITENTRSLVTYILSIFT